MGRASNETNLIVALLKEKVAARRLILSHTKPENERLQNAGMNWVLDTLNEIISQEIIGK